MADSTGMTKVFQMTHPTTGEPMSPVVSVGSLYDKNGKKVDNLVSYKVAGTGVTIPELADVTGDMQAQVNTMLDAANAQVDEKLAEVDTAIAGIDELIASSISNNIVFGTYIGNSPKTTSKTINLGFKPKAVIIFSRAGSFGSENESSSGMALDGYDCMSSSYTGISITSTGFTVYSQGINYGNGVRFASNDGDFSPYRYIAWR